MHKGRDPSHLSSEATAGYACGYADFGLGETGDLLMDPGLPYPSLTNRLRRNPATFTGERVECGWLVTPCLVDESGSAADRVTMQDGLRTDRIERG